MIEFFDAIKDLLQNGLIVLIVLIKILTVISK